MTCQCRTETSQGRQGRIEMRVFGTKDYHLVVCIHKAPALPGSTCGSQRHTSYSTDMESLASPPASRSVGGDPQSTEPGDITGGRGKCHTGKLTQTCHVPFLRLWRTEITAINHYVCGISLHPQRGFCPTRMNYVPHLGFLLESLSEPQG